MKKSILNLGNALNRAEQKLIHGGISSSFNPCPCSNSYTVDWVDSKGEVCSYPTTLANSTFPGSRCSGRVKNDVCCLEH